MNMVMVYGMPRIFWLRGQTLGLDPAGKKSGISIRYQGILVECIFVIEMTYQAASRNRRAEACRDAHRYQTGIAKTPEEQQKKM